MGKKTILIADDEPHIVELIRLCLGERYSYLIAYDGEEALRLIKEKRPDIVLLDVMMPKLNGFEVCTRVKGDRRLKGTVIAMLSAKTQEQDIIQGLKLGADHYLTKPFHPAEFEMKVRTIAEGKNPKSENEKNEETASAC